MSAKFRLLYCKIDPMDVRCFRYGIDICWRRERSKNGEIVVWNDKSWFGWMGTGVRVKFTFSNYMVREKWFVRDRRAVAADPRKMFRPNKHASTCEFYTVRLDFSPMPVDSDADKMLESYQIVCLSIFALCLSTMTWCQCAGTTTVYSATIILLFPVYNVSALTKKKEREIETKDTKNAWMSKSIYEINRWCRFTAGVVLLPHLHRHDTYRILFPVAHFRVYQMLKQPINWLIIVEHLKECYQPWQFSRFEHFSCENTNRRDIPMELIRVNKVTHAPNNNKNKQ